MSPEAQQSIREYMLWRDQLAPVDTRTTIVPRRQKPKPIARHRIAGHCVYCGAPTATLACSTHRDLPGKDPAYAAMTERMFADRTIRPRRAERAKVAA